MIFSGRGDRFAILLCRPELPDSLHGNLRLIIRNPLWSDQYRITDIALESYPVSDLSAVTTVAQVGTDVRSLP